MNKPTNSGPGRRTVLTGAAWTAPVLAATFAAPLAAAGVGVPDRVLALTPFVAVPTAGSAPWDATYLGRGRDDVP
ncbi:hypothetical protein HQQ81_06415 [Microbacteriaceae bacterium VKM Ac-2854]|nr:hypothetical protein [Microbacteriaceae bacterium VKM Ac-2854]